VTPDPKQEDGNNRKRFWTFIEHRRSDGNSIPLLKTAGVLHTDSKDKANILNRQFQQAFSEKIDITSEECRQQCSMNSRYPEVKDINVTKGGRTETT
jgi:hypothetical protein